MGWLLPAIGAVSGLLGAFGQNSQNAHNSAAMQQMIDQVMGNASAVQGETLDKINGLFGTAGQYQQVLPGLLQAIMGEQSPGGAAAQAPGAASAFMQDAMSPGALSATTGVNPAQLAMQALGFLSSPGSTSLAQVAPGAMTTFAQQAQSGVAPQFALNAQNQLGQQFDSSMSTIRANAAPGQNLNAAQQAAQNNLLTQSTNLGGQLAGESQGLRQQGAQGMLSAASGLDQQTMQMLMQAFGLGQGYNQSVLGNQQAGAGFGQGLLDMIQGFAGQGNQLSEFGTSALGSLGSSLSQQGQYFSGLAANQPQPQNPFSLVGNALSGFNFNGLFGGHGGGSTGGFVPYQGTGGVSAIGQTGNLIDVLG